MTAKRVKVPEPDATNHRVATTPGGRENQLISLAVDLAERQLREGTASAQVVSHYLKAGSSREYLEQQRLAMEVELMKAKQEQLSSMARVEDLYEGAITAMRAYQGAQVVAPDEVFDA